MNTSDSSTNTKDGDTGLSGAAGSAPSERERRKWWAVTDGGARLVTGYSCAPTNPKMWWCPEVGFSMSEGHHLFETEAEAIDKKIEELERLLTETNEQLTAFRLQRQNAASEPRGKEAPPSH